MLELMGSMKKLQENYRDSKKDCRTQIYCFSISRIWFLTLSQRLFCPIQKNIDYHHFTKKTGAEPLGFGPLGPLLSRFLAPLTKS